MGKILAILAVLLLVTTLALGWYLYTGQDCRANCARQCNALGLDAATCADVIYRTCYAPDPTE